MSPILNNQVADRLFLEACFNQDRRALNLWIAHSYHVEVAEGMRAAARRFAPGLIDPEEIESLVVVCTSNIYKQHAELPSRLYSLKTRVRDYAYAYMTKYLRNRFKNKQ